MRRSEGGSHMVSVTVNNRTVPGSPFKVHAWPHELYLPLSRMFGDGLYSCTAGKVAQVTLDRTQARTKQGGK